MSKLSYTVFNSKQAAAEALAKHLFELFQPGTRALHIAISGGSTPFIMFNALAEKYGALINWSNIHFYWVDERCVVPTSDESNFGNTQKAFFKHINIPKENIHRAFGENEPYEEARRYSSDIEVHVQKENSLPQFDVVLLGMGDDGHTASIFPHQIDFIHAEQTAIVAENPNSGQKRISLSGTVINNAKHIYFLVTGKSKAAIFNKILFKKDDYLKYPAAHISMNSKQTHWFLDNEVVGNIVE